MGKWRIRKRRLHRKKLMLVKLDKEDFVISVTREELDSRISEIERSDHIMPETRICKGPWHYRGGKGTVLPLSAFPENRYRKGTITKTCGECLDKSGRRSAVPLGVKPETPVMLVKNLEGDGFLPANGGAMHKWEVTIVQTSVVVVYAKDYTHAGKEAGEGEVTNVRRLD